MSKPISSISSVDAAAFQAHKRSRSAHETRALPVLSKDLSSDSDDSTAASQHQQQDTTSASSLTPEILTPKASSAEPPDVNSDTRKRRRHRKSRLGCLQCKRRKIKCNEARPTCVQCSIKGLSCIYTTTLSAEDLSLLQYTSSALLSRQQIGSLQPPGMTFNSTDMRLHHHFIINAYPHHPIGNDKVWTHYIAARAEKYPHLLHAMLALAASNLSAHVADPSEYETSALTHRITAINGVNATMASKPLEDFEIAERDALLGACYALCFQSNYLEDGMIDYITMARGCGLIIRHIRQAGLTTGFQFLGREQQREVMLPRLLSFPSAQPGFLNPAPGSSSEGFILERSLTSWIMPSVAALEPLIESEEENRVWRGLVSIADIMDTDPIRAYLSSSMSYTLITHMSTTGFANFISQENLVARVLLAYVIATLVMLHPIASREWYGRESQVPEGVVAVWIRKIFKAVEDHDRKVKKGSEHPREQKLAQFIAWPMAVAEFIEQKERRKEPCSLSSDSPVFPPNDAGGGPEGTSGIHNAFVSRML